MRDIVVKCDRCGKDISSDTYKTHLNLELYYRHYGSIGGDEDIDELDFDLCDDCSRILSYNIKRFLKK